MARVAIAAATLLSTFALSACLSPTARYSGYIVDEAQPTAMEPGIDTRASVLARLGSPSTRSVFDDNTWFYVTSTTENLAFLKPKTTARRITGVRFNDQDVVEEILTYSVDDGQVINYASRETPTLGRQLTFLEQLLGSIGAVTLPNSTEVTPSNPTGRN